MKKTNIKEDRPRLNVAVLVAVGCDILWLTFCSSWMGKIPVSSQYHLI